MKIIKALPIFGNALSLSNCTSSDSTQPVANRGGAVAPESPAGIAKQQGDRISESYLKLGRVKARAFKTSTTQVSG